MLDIVEEYEAGATQPELAAKYRAHRTTIIRALEREGVRARRKVRKLTDDQVDDAAQLYRSGLSMTKVAGRLGVGSSTVRRELVRTGVVLRSRGRS